MHASLANGHFCSLISITLKFSISTSHLIQPLFCSKPSHRNYQRSHRYLYSVPASAVCQILSLLECEGLWLQEFVKHFTIFEVVIFSLTCWAGPESEVMFAMPPQMTWQGLRWSQHLQRPGLLTHSTPRSSAPACPTRLSPTRLQPLPQQPHFMLRLGHLFLSFLFLSLFLISLYSIVCHFAVWIVSVGCYSLLIKLM